MHGIRTVSPAVSQDIGLDELSPLMRTGRLCPLTGAAGWGAMVYEDTGVPFHRAHRTIKFQIGRPS